MNRLILTVSVVLLAAVARGQDDRGKGPPVVSSITQYASIFVLDIEDARPSAWNTDNPQVRSVAVRARITRVLKDGNNQGLAPGEFSAQLQQAHLRGGRVGHLPYFWSYLDVQAGQQYLIFSNSKAGTPVAMFESPDMVELITNQSGAIADIELILGLARAPIPQQTAAVAVALRNSPKQRSHFLAEYAAALLAAGTDSDTAELTKVTEDKASSAFSEDDKRSLLWALFQESRKTDSPPRNLLHVFSTLTANALLTESKPALTPDQANILQNYIPWLQGSERATGFFRAAISKDQAQRLRQKALQLSNDPNASTEQKKQIQELIGLTGAADRI